MVLTPLWVVEQNSHQTQTVKLGLAVRVLVSHMNARIYDNRTVASRIFPVVELDACMDRPLQVVSS